MNSNTIGIVEVGILTFKKPYIIANMAANIWLSCYST